MTQGIRSHAAAFVVFASGALACGGSSRDSHRNPAASGRGGMSYSAGGGGSAGAAGRHDGGGGQFAGRGGNAASSGVAGHVGTAGRSAGSGGAAGSSAGAAGTHASAGSGMGGLSGSSAVGGEGGGGEGGESGAGGEGAAGTSGPVLTIDPIFGPFDFYVGDPVPPIVFTVSNTGSAASGTFNVMLAGCQYMTLTGNTCLQPLPPGQSCELTVAYQPPNPASGSCNASLIVSADGFPGGMTQVPLFGEAP